MSIIFSTNHYFVLLMGMAMFLMLECHRYKIRHFCISSGRCDEYRQEGLPVMVFRWLSFYDEAFELDIVDKILNPIYTPKAICCFIQEKEYALGDVYEREGTEYKYV